MSVVEFWNWLFIDAWPILLLLFFWQLTGKKITNFFLFDFKPRSWCIVVVFFSDCCSLNFIIILITVPNKNYRYMTFNIPPSYWHCVVTCNTILCMVHTLNYKSLMPICRGIKKNNKLIPNLFIVIQHFFISSIYFDAI